MRTVKAVPARDTAGYGYSLASEAKAARTASRQQEEARQTEREREWDPGDPSDPMNLAMGGDTGLGYGL